MPNRERTSNPNYASDLFAEWAALFSERLFVILQTYSDESGTNDLAKGRQPGSAVPILCGYIETPEYWTGFCRKWQTILKDYRADYFHFREFANKREYAKENSPYYGWSEKKRDRFLYDLALLVSESAVPVGGFYSAKKHHELGLLGNPFESSATHFFESVLYELNVHWPHYREKVLFVFDRCEDDRIIVPIHKAHSAISKRDSRIGGLSFEDDKDPKHVALQAADLYSYVSRQQAERYMASGMKQVPELRLLDFILNRNMYPQLKKFPWPVWMKTVLTLREDQKRQKAIWAKQGLAKKVYYPDEHFPFEKYGIEKQS